MKSLQATAIPLSEELAILRHDIAALKNSRAALKESIQDAIDILERAEAELRAKNLDPMT